MIVWLSCMAPIENATETLALRDLASKISRDSSGLCAIRLSMALRSIAIAAVLIGGIHLPLAICYAQELEFRDPTPSERAWIGSKLYEAASRHFAHWEDVPDLDLDVWYRKYLDNAMEAKGRREFSLASMEFVAGLRNGHSSFYDQWLSKKFGGSPGFSLRMISDRWIITASRLAGIVVGDEVVGIDDETFDEFFERQKRYIAASSESARRRQLFWMSYLFPESFDLVFASGMRRSVNRMTQELQDRAHQASPEPRLVGNGIAYLPIRSFSEPEFEQRAIDFITQHQDAKTLIIDVRGNSGGSTPVFLVNALMDRPWSGWIEATPYHLGLASAYSQVRRREASTPEQGWWQGYIDAFSRMKNSMLLFPGEMKQPEQPIYTNDLIVLVDEECASACEGFVMPLRYSDRAVVVGRSTDGSSGQPYMFEFGNGMSFRIGAKRMYFPDGSRFEGVGIVPHIEVPITIDSVLSEADEILDQAIEIALTNRR